MVQWRNWYTRRTQNAVPERGCGFESHLDYNAPVAQLGEAVVSDTIQCGFESRWGYRVH